MGNFGELLAFSCDLYVVLLQQNPVIHNFYYKNSNLEIGAHIKPFCNLKDLVLKI